MNRPDVNTSKGLQITNIITLIAWLILLILSGVFNGLAELYLAIFVMSILYSVVNIAYLVSRDVSGILSRYYFIVGIVSGILLILSVVEFIRLIVSWAEYFQLLETFRVLIALFFLVSVMAQNTSFFFLAWKEKRT